jgi:hypothetical protein
MGSMAIKDENYWTCCQYTTFGMNMVSNHSTKFASSIHPEDDRERKTVAGAFAIHFW